MFKYSIIYYILYKILQNIIDNNLFITFIFPFFYSQKYYFIYILIILSITSSLLIVLISQVLCFITEPGIIPRNYPSFKIKDFLINSPIFLHSPSKFSLGKLLYLCTTLMSKSNFVNNFLLYFLILILPCI